MNIPRLTGALLAIALMFSSLWYIGFTDAFHDKDTRPAPYLRTYVKAHELVYQSRDIFSVLDAIKENTVMEVDPVLRFAARERMSSSPFAPLLVAVSHPVSNVRLFFTREILVFENLQCRFLSICKLY